MNTREENVRKVLNEYDLMRTKAENICQKRIEKIYKEFPKLKQIKDKINQLGFENTKNIMKNPKNAKELNADFEKNLAKLLKEKEDFIKENNIPADFEKPIYNCDICNDTGYVGDKKCKCFEQKLIKKAYEESNLGNLLYDHSFDKFSLDYYSPRASASGKESDREAMKDVFEECVNFCKTFDNSNKNLFMVGKSGLGKTFLSNCIAREMLDRGKSVVYMRATSLFAQYEEYKYGKKSDEDFNMDRFYSADLLIIDDLGTENISKASTSFFFDLLNERIDRNKKIIINTNFSMKDISTAYTSRITSRIYEFFTILYFKGKDIRIQKLN